MPGVPSGRACDACRIARKKCDSAVPLCSRCLRLNLLCVGSGQRRFHFKGPKCERKPARGLTQPLPSPISAVQLLAESLVKTISLETEYRFSLLYSYGPFLNYLPQRLGLSEALDSACQALVLAHHDICSNQSASVSTTVAYGTAIHKLRMALDDPTEATSIHSLGAAALLVICRDLNGFSFQDWRIHSLGAAEIVYARRHILPQDEFERELLDTLQGYLVGHCIIFRHMRLDPGRFEKLVEAFTLGLEPDNVVCSMYKLPRLLQRGRTVRNDTEAKQRLIQEVTTAYEAMTARMHDLRYALKNVFVHESIRRAQTLGYYALELSVCLIYDCILRALDSRQRNCQVTRETLAEATLCLAEDTVHFAPLGSSYMFLPLSLAWVHAEDATTKHRIRSALLDLQQRYHRGVSIEYPTLHMEELRRDLQMEEDE